MSTPHDSGSGPPRRSPGSVTMDPLIGSIVLDRYEIVRRIGSGGMGSVYIGRQKAVSRDVALKILRSDLMTNEHVKERFRREAEIIGKLRHPNTIQLIDYGETPEGLAIMVMELLVGTPLNDRLKEKGPLPIADAITVGMEIAQSLAEAHLLGMVHRDLKPANIFLVNVAGQTHVKVLDFGIARILDEEATRLTSTGQVFGTPRYMSPEQALSTGEVDSRSDLYSLGLIIYECIVGQPPFVAQTSIQYLSAHSTMAPPKLRDHYGEAPVELENLIDACLAKAPEERPQTAAEVVQHLAQIKRVIEAGGSMQPLPLPVRGASTRPQPLVLQTEPPAKSAATHPAMSPSATATAISGGGRTTEVHDPTLIRPTRPPPEVVAAASKPPVLMFAGIGMVVLALLLGGGLWYMNRDDMIVESPIVDSGAAPLAMLGSVDAAVVAEVVEVEAPPDAGAPDLSDAGDEETFDAGALDPVEKTKSKGKNGGRNKNKSKTKQQNAIMTERGEGVTTGPATMTIETGEDGESLAALAKKCSSSVLKGRAKMTIKKCPDGCAVIVDEKCGGKTPATDVPLANGFHAVAVVCGSKIVMETSQRFPPEETTELSCR